MRTPSELGDHANSSEIDDLLSRYVEALAAQSFEAYPLTEEVTFRGPRLGPITGAEAARSTLVQVAGAFSRFDAVNAGQLVDGDEAVLRLEVTLPDGRGFAIADHLRFRHGATAYVRPYFDAGLLESLGFAPSVDDLGPRARL